MSSRSIYVFATVLVISCGGQSEDKHSSHDASGLEDRLRDCDLLSTGYWNTSDRDPSVACAAPCLANAECDALRAFFCDAATDVGTCVATCTEPGLLSCQNGNGIYRREQKCDGFNDCPDESDEAGCGHVVCPNGPLVPVEDVCDGIAQCPGGEDEATCDTFDCGNGATIPARLRCDGTIHCAGSADEQGCARVTCGP